MSELFTTCVRIVLKEEGGLSNNKYDPGGMTKYGISKRSHPDIDIENLSEEQAIKIYHNGYWLPIYGDDIPPSLALIVFDSAVNQGVNASIQMLQKAVGVNPDGMIGSITLNAIHLMSTEVAINNFCAERALRYEMNRNEVVFGRGWYRRLFRTHATALSWLWAL